MVSVVIVARNEEKHIEACLEALTYQTTNQPFEVILVSRSDDNTNQIAKQFIKRLDLRILSQPKPGRGAARAVGFAAARGDIILSTDGDSQTPADWVEKLSTKLELGNAVAITGTCRIDDCGAWRNWWFNQLQPLFMRCYKLVQGHYWLTGSNFGIKRQAYEASGGFDPAVTDVEDIDLGFRVHRLGRIEIARDCPVLTSGKRFQAGIIKGLIPYIKAFGGRFWLKQGNRYGRD